jgi:hypothetical protein
MPDWLLQASSPCVCVLLQAYMGTGREDVASDDGEQRPHRRRRTRRSRRPAEAEGNRLVAAIVVGVVVVLFAVGGWYYFKSNSQTETTLAEMRALPLVGAMIADNPDAEARLKAAIQEEINNPSADGTTRPLALIADLRRQYILPALKASDDASAMAAVAARAALAAHLQKASPPACREFAAGGIQRPDRLDGEGQRLFRNVLQALETAYRNGRANGKPLPMPSRAEILDLLRDAGFQKVDFDRLNAFASLSNEVACEIELKVDQVPPKLPADKRGAFARFVLNN